MAKKDVSITTLDILFFEFGDLSLVGIVLCDRGFGSATFSAFPAWHIRGLPKTMKNQSLGSQEMSTITDLKTQ